MKKSLAREIAKSVSNDELLIMMYNAKDGVGDWTVASNVNKSISKGVAWNILCRDFLLEKKYSELIKTNMIREFGEFLPSLVLERFAKKRKVRVNVDIVHQEPEFENFPAPF